jgi:hypothetical protein
MNGKAERFFWGGYSYEQEKEWKKRREELRREHGKGDPIIQT